MSNLVLSCPGCNLAKAERTRGEDFSGRSQPLFNRAISSRGNSVGTCILLWTEKQA